MDYYPTDTIDRPIAEALPVQPNTPAPIAHVPQQQFAIPQQMGWLTPRNVAIAVGGVVVLTIAVLGARTGGESQPIRVAAIQNVAPSSAAANAVVLEKSKASLDEIRLAARIRIKEDQIAMLNDRSQEILREAKRQLSDRNSGCFRSPYGAECFVVSFINEHRQRYRDAALAQQWNTAVTTLFQVEAAQIALDGLRLDDTGKLPKFTPAVTSAAIARETEARVNLAKQSDNAIAHDMFGATK